MPAVVVRNHEKSVLVEILRKGLITRAVLGHAVHDLHESFGILRIQPFVNEDFFAVETFEYHIFFHPPDESSMCFLLLL